MLFMKSSKTFTLDIEVIEKLNQTKNASELVNNLLDQYFHSNKEKTLEEKLLEIESIENEVVKAKQLKMKELEEQIIQSQQALKKIQEEQIKQLEENIKLIESHPELVEELKAGIYTDLNFLMDIVAKYRNKGLRIGVKQLQTYLKNKND